MILADSVETVGVGLRTVSKGWESERESEKQKVQGEVLAHLEEQKPFRKVT